MSHLKHLAALVLLMMLTLPLSAQEKTDSVFTFRFFIGKDGFYAPGLNNGEELARMYDCVDLSKDLIKDHKIMVYVNGYSTSEKSEAENRRIAKIRSNRVKSELIVLKGLKEDNFITRNHTDQGNFVTVSFLVPVDRIESTPVETPAQPLIEETVEPEADISETIEVSESSPEPEIETITPEPEIETIVSQLTMREEVKPYGIGSDSPFALKTNLLFYPILMPNLEVEWKFSEKWSVALEGQIAWYAKEDPHKVYRIATVIPEARYWVINRSQWHGMYVGAFVGGGLYDLCNGKKNGHEGEGILAGASVGYMWPISKHLSLDAGLGLGYARIRDKEYRPLDGHFLYQRTKYINYFGPLRLKLSLVWRIPG